MVIASPSESRQSLDPRVAHPSASGSQKVRSTRCLGATGTSARAVDVHKTAGSLPLPGPGRRKSVDHRGSPRWLQRNAGCKLLQEAHSLCDAFLTYDEVVRLQEERICTQRSSSPMATLVVDRAKRRTKRCERGICDRPEGLLRQERIENDG